ncbi:cyclin box fold domain-containing protein [Stylonychia lemnae]|uniref:Cyclin box fold domain-containing protein n=1 Tax=Stylonychia lemnae TaxID=5949 RepID=A0A078A7F2_STYLE|nr:cyclin box fold domain-containing protein [Stylonychia lemnae]|eukprot:CDW76721.1 cyclin box fold domain-containing protein [Stylonychia lemnae]
MTDFLTSTQLSEWFYTSEDDFRRKQGKFYQKMCEKIDKYTNQPAPSLPGGPPAQQPIYRIIKPDSQHKLLAWIANNIAQLCIKLKLSYKIMGISLTYMRRFYLKQSVFEFDPVRMMFACIFLAMKVEEFDEDLQGFCNRVNMPDKCDPSKLEQLEVLLVRGLGFQLLIYTPFQVYEYLLETIVNSTAGLDMKLIRKYSAEQVTKVFQSSSLIFTFTPQILALSCVDLAIQQYSAANTNPDIQIQTLNEYFPDLKLAILEKVGNAKEKIMQIAKLNDQEIQKIRKYIQHFHQQHPEFLDQIQKDRVKRENKTMLCGFDDEPKVQTESNNKQQQKASLQQQIQQQDMPLASKALNEQQQQQELQQKNNDSLRLQQIGQNQTPIQLQVQLQPSLQISQDNLQNQDHFISNNQQKLDDSRKAEFLEPLIPLRKRKSEMISGDPLAGKPDPSKLRKLNPGAGPIAQ